MAEQRPVKDGLVSGEHWWKDHYKQLETCGYMLRPRYSLDWVPSWRATGDLWVRCEDGQGLSHGSINDATRLSDGKFVALKMVYKSDHPYEAEIGQYFSSETISSDPRNHCVPILEILQVPDEDDLIFLVMPLLSLHNQPSFDTFGEIIEFFRQVFEGLQFMHENHIAHQDCMNYNIMVDSLPLYPKPYHPRKMRLTREFNEPTQPFTRTQVPVKYYLIDFGISRRYKTEDLPALEYPILGGDKSVPEFQNSDELCDPFPTDIYYVGNLIREDFVQRYFGFGFMKNLVVDMVQDDPTKRPTIQEVVDRFEKFAKSLSSCKLRSQAVRREKRYRPGAFERMKYWARRIKFVLRRVPLVPAL